MPNETDNHDFFLPDKNQDGWGDGKNDDWADLDLLLKHIASDGSAIGTEADPLPTQHVEKSHTGELSVTGGDPPSRYLTANDDVAMHTGNVVAISDTWTTIFDIAAPTELLGGSLYGRHQMVRLTIDGAVIIDTENTIFAARDGAGDVFNAPVVPPAKAESSMKLETKSKSGDENDTGWLFYTR